jgi:RHS repeat-associated protein
MFNRADWLMSQSDAVDPAKSVSFAYDLNGNQTGRGTATATRQMKWDARNTLTAVFENGTEVGRYDYDRNLIRVRRVTQSENVEYVLDDKHVLNELDGSQANKPSIRRYHYGTKVLAVTESAGTNYVLNDGIGSASDFWNSGGLLAKSRQYDAWGNFRNGTAPSSSEAKVAYTGHQYDPETGWVYAKARYYDSGLGVFLSRDSYEGEIGDAPSLHRFAYARENPLRYWDPDGYSDAATVIQYSAPWVSLLPAVSVPAVGTAAGGVVVVAGGVLVVAGTGYVLWELQLEALKADPLNAEANCPFGGGACSRFAQQQYYSKKHEEERRRAAQASKEDQSGSGDPENQPTGNKEPEKKPEPGKNAKESEAREKAKPDIATPAPSERARVENRPEAEFETGPYLGAAPPAKATNGPTDSRVKLRKATLADIEKAQPRNAKGQLVDPNTEKPLKPGEIDVGHKPSEEWKTRKKMHEEKGSTRKEVVEAENNPKLYQLEDKHENRSHRHEKKDD